MSVRVGSATFLSLALTASVAAAPPSSPPPRKIALHLGRVDASRYPQLTLFVRVIDDTGAVVTDRTRQDFALQVDEEMLPAATDVKTVDQTGEPLYAVLVVPARLATRPVQGAVKKIATASAEVGSSRLALLAVDGRVRRVAQLDQLPQELQALTERLSPTDGGSDGEARLLDGVRLAVDLLEARSVPPDVARRVIVIADGSGIGDADEHRDQDLARRLSRSGIVLDTVGVGSSTALRRLGNMALQTGGVAREARDTAGLVAQLAHVEQDFQKQYRLLFSVASRGVRGERSLQLSTEIDGHRFASNAVTILVPGRPDPPPPRPSIWRRWRTWIAIGGGVALAAVALLFLLLRRSDRRSGQSGDQPS